MNDFNRLEQYSEDRAGSYSRAGDNDGGGITADFLEAIRAEISDPVATVHSNQSGLKFFGFCSTHKWWGSQFGEWSKAWRDAESHNLRLHN